MVFKTIAPFFYLQICSTPIWWKIHFLRSTVSPAKGFILSHALTRMTNPSAEGAFWETRLRTRKDFASAGTTKGRSPSGGFAIALWKSSPDHPCNYAAANVGRSRRLCQPP